ncbi:efflux RND transporter periplasmic adaptor subunit [Edaphobacter modestus]|uniref:RND family efflux transporter MFP subunit n=1 Tax=Edaphobacter modestus TaxID=388466 RepID=A0A4Q7YUN5_9BACT|nr:efflux RND transporter periplasmic adaptor subunit [Edaphobacter modestus]RZU41487.1 RND family efflux transporter MFP subunit [Edaphobacter modestus]
MYSHKTVAILTLAFGLPAGAQTPAHVEFATVESRTPSRTVSLPAELAPFLQADIEARVPGYIERVLVDRGSNVRRGQLLVELSAPEMKAQTSAAESTLHQAEADESQAEAQAAGIESTFARLEEASKTPGAVAGNELVQAEKQRDAAHSLVNSRKAATRAAQDRLRATKELEAYLRVTAPFDGTITDRFVHPGMLVQANAHTPLLKLQQVAHLRLTVPVPESYVGHVVRGTSVSFHIAAQPGKSYAAKIARIPNALDPQSRTMMVELDAYNKDGTLAPGMYPSVDWPVSSADPLLLVPSTSVVSTTERTFVITSVNGRAHWVDVRKGAVFGEQVAIRANIKQGEKVLKRASDEIREGTPLI